MRIYFLVGMLLTVAGCAGREGPPVQYRTPEVPSPEDSERLLLQVQLGLAITEAVVTVWAAEGADVAGIRTGLSRAHSVLVVWGRENERWAATGTPPWAWSGQICDPLSHVTETLLWEAEQSVGRERAAVWHPLAELVPVICRMATL